jgi:hypothetical protein
VTLRPVSELGLVDLTDLASGENSATPARHPPRRAPSPRSKSARRDATTSTPANKRASAEKGSGGKPRSVRADTPEGSKRSGSQSKHTPGSSAGAGRNTGAGTRRRRRNSGSGARPASGVPRRRASSTTGARRGASTDRRRSAPTSQRRLNGGSPKTRDAMANAKPNDESRGSLAAKTGISVVTGAMGIAGGLLFSRTALRR